jgi:hypothetical protein
MVLDNHRASLLTRNGKCYSVQRARIPPLFDIDDLTYYNESVGNVNPPNPEQSTIIRNCNGGTFLYDNSILTGAVMLETMWRTRKQDLLDLISPFISYSVAKVRIQSFLR